MKGFATHPVRGLSLIAVLLFPFVAQAESVSGANHGFAVRHELTIAAAVDLGLGEQMRRLLRLIETGNSSAQPR